jgi:hypothetical protein
MDSDNSSDDDEEEEEINEDIKPILQACIFLQVHDSRFALTSIVLFHNSVLHFFDVSMLYVPA